MRLYRCEKCEIDTVLNVCPQCGSKTQLHVWIYWSKSKNIPIISSYNDSNSDLIAIARDIRPVFPQERLLLECILGEPLKYLKSSCWRLPNGIYIIDGKKESIMNSKHEKILIKDLNTLDVDKIRDMYKVYESINTDVYFQKYIDIFIHENKKRYQYIDSEVSEFLESYLNKDISNMFISISGGKDSTVVSDIVTRALGTPKITHIFGDTTLEFPETYEYIKRFKKDHRFTPVITAKNREKNFFEMAEIIGPPSRVMRWCCTVFKTGAITRYIDSLYKNKPKIIAFQGIRHSESISRSKYTRESDSPKITKQRVVSPIIEWNDFDVWLYIFTRKLDFNEAYKLGFSRVGCWCCPNNGFWSEFLSKIFHPEQYYPWHNQLIRNAINIGKEDPEEYVSSGAWKAKQGGEGIQYAKNNVVSFEPCAVEENSFNYELNKPIDENLYELFKPFGKINFDIGNQRLHEVVVLDRNNNIIIKLQGKQGDTHLKISILNPRIAGAKNFKDARRKIECQITKFQMCLNCSACMSVCRFDAIKIKYKNNKLNYKIDENKCTNCHECINHYTSGCYLKKVLATRNEMEGRKNENKI